MSKKHTVKVHILGEEYTIRSDAPPEQAKAVAQHFDGLVRHVMSSGSVVETHRAAILAALQVTAELFQERAAARELTASMTGLGAEIKRLLPPAKRG